MKSRNPASTHKKVAVVLLDGDRLTGYVNPQTLGNSDSVDLLTLDGERQAVRLSDMRCVYFIREFQEPLELERKTFLSRPKLDGLWVRLRFSDGDEMEGIVSNDLLGLLDTGVQLTPPDLHGNVLHMFIPRSALAEMKVLGVVGAARRTGQPERGTRPAAAAQSNLFTE